MYIKFLCIKHRYPTNRRLTFSSMKDSHLMLIPSQGPQISNLCREEYCSMLSVSVRVILQSVVRVNSTAPSIILRSKVIQSARPNIVIFVSENQQVNLTTIETTLFWVENGQKKFLHFFFYFCCFSYSQRNWQQGNKHFIQTCMSIA